MNDGQREDAMRKRLVVIGLAVVGLVAGYGMGKHPGKPWSESIEHRPAREILQVDLSWDLDRAPQVKIEAVKPRHGHPDTSTPDGRYKLVVHDRDMTVASAFVFARPSL